MLEPSQSKLKVTICSLFECESIASQQHLGALERLFNYNRWPSCRFAGFSVCPFVAGASTKLAEAESGLALLACCSKRLVQATEVAARLQQLNIRQRPNRLILSE